MGDRRPKRRSHETWPEAHYANPQDAEAGDFPAWSPKQPGCDGAGTAESGPPTPIPVAQIQCIESSPRSALDRPAPEDSVYPKLRLPQTTMRAALGILYVRLSIKYTVRCMDADGVSGSHYNYPTNAKSCQQAPIHREERRLPFLPRRHRIGIPLRQVCIY